MAATYDIEGMGLQKLADRPSQQIQTVKSGIQRQRAEVGMTSHERTLPWRGSTAEIGQAD